MSPRPPACPACQSPMKKRTAKRGPNPGNKFWGCSKWPKCKATKPFVSAQSRPTSTKSSRSKRQPLAKGYESEPYRGENPVRTAVKEKPFLEKMGLKEIKHVGRARYAPKVEKNYPLQYIDEGIAGTREDNKRSRAQNFSDIRKRNS